MLRKGRRRVTSTETLSLTLQVSLAELKQEVNAAKSLSNSASAVLQTNASLQDVQHRIFTPRTAPSPKAARPLLRLGDARRVPHEESPAPQITTTPPQAMQWLATGVSPSFPQSALAHAHPG